MKHIIAEITKENIYFTKHNIGQNIGAKNIPTVSHNFGTSARRNFVRYYKRTIHIGK